MNLKLEGGEDPDIVSFEANNLMEEIQGHRETLSDRAYKDAIIRVVLQRPHFLSQNDSLDDVKHLPHRRAR